MTVKAIILILTLAHGGFWFGGRPNRVEWTWNVPAAQVPAAEFRWKMLYGKLVIANGVVAFPAGKDTGSFEVTLPEFREMADLVLHYELVQTGNGTELQTGDLPLHGVPGGVLKEAGKLVAKKKIAVLDSEEGLPSLLKEAGIDFRRIRGLSDLQLTSPDVLVIGQDALGDVLADADLLERARGGANVVILAQSKAKETAGYPLGEHSTRAPLTMAERHPLLVGFSLDDLQNWARSRGALLAIQLPAREPAHELLHWPVETPGTVPSPVDALLITRTMAAGADGTPGRIIHWQIPMANWSDDPRVSKMLANILEYTVTRPQPTLPADQRTPAATKPQTISTDLFQRD